MRKFGIFVFLTILMSGIVGCGGMSKYLSEKDTPETTCLVVGYLDADKTPTHVGWVQLKQYLPKTDKPIWNCRVDNGLFYREGLLPGSYALDNYGGGSTDVWASLNGDKGAIISFSSQEAGYHFEKAGKIYFLGSFKVHYKGDLFSEKYAIEEIKTPSELEVMKKLLVNSKGSPWVPYIESRIEQLSAQKAE